MAWTSPKTTGRGRKKGILRVTAKLVKPRRQKKEIFVETGVVDERDWKGGKITETAYHLNPENRFQPDRPRTTQHQQHIVPGRRTTKQLWGIKRTITAALI